MNVLRMPPRRKTGKTRPGSKKPTRKLPAELLTPDEVRGMLAKTGRGKTGIRNRAIVFVLWRSGVRAAELVALRPKDLDPKAGSVRVLHGKGDRSRTIGMAPDAFAAVDAWVGVRRDLDPVLSRTAPLFCTLQGGELATSYLRKMIPRLGRRAGIEKRVHPHGLRHAFAVTLRTKKVPMDIIMRQLGHSDLGTTFRYLARIAPEELLETLRDLAWE